MTFNSREQEEADRVQAQNEAMNRAAFELRESKAQDGSLRLSLAGRLDRTSAPRLEQRLAELRILGTPVRLGPRGLGSHRPRRSPTPDRVPRRRRPPGLAVRDRAERLSRGSERASARAPRSPHGRRHLTRLVSHRGGHRLGHRLPGVTCSPRRPRWQRICLTATSPSQAESPLVAQHPASAPIESRGVSRTVRLLVPRPGST